MRIQRMIRFLVVILYYFFTVPSSLQVICPPNHFKYPINSKQQINAMKLKYGTIDVVDNEQQLISCFLKQFKQFDADLIIAHQMAGNQLDLLIDKCRKYRIQEVYNLGRLSKSTPVYVCRAWS